LCRIEIELAHHGGRDNGNLPVTYDDFVHYGVRRHQVGPALHELAVLGFVEIKPGRAGIAPFRQPHRFRLTYRHTSRDEPTNEWRQIATMEEAKKLGKEIRKVGRKKRKFSDGCGTDSSDGRGHQNHSPTSVTTGHSPTSVTTFESFGVGAAGRGPLQEPETNPRMTIRTTVIGRGAGIVEVIHDDERCYGFLRRNGTGYEAYWSGERFDDHFIGEFTDKTLAIDAVVKAVSDWPTTH